MKQRIITAVIALPIFLVILLSGNMNAIGTLLTVCAAVSVYEAVGMLLPKFESLVSKGKLSHQGMLYCLVLYAALIFSLFVWGSYEQCLMAAFILFFLNLIVTSFISHDNDLAVVRLGATSLGFSYGIFSWFFIWNLLSLSNGLAYVGLLCALVWAGDTGAYFGGKSFGRTKLAPRMSPNKTREGSVSGIISSAIAAFLVNYAAGLNLDPTMLLVMSVVAGVTAQIGDLVESTLKRFSGVKDSGFIFPGHGGLLDRVDGVIFAAPVVWIFVHYIF